VYVGQVVVVGFLQIPYKFLRKSLVFQINLGCFGIDPTFLMPG
jgi:hypothetical protein